MRTIGSFLYEDLGFNSQRGIQTFSFSNARNKTAEFFPFFSTTHFTFLSFFKFNILILILVVKEMTTLAQPMVEDKRFRQIRWDLKSAFNKFILINKNNGKQGKAM